MTESEWLECVDPTPILEFLQANVSERKLRLFAVACSRRVWDQIDEQEVLRGLSFLVDQCGAADHSTHITSDCGRRAVHVAEEHADGLTDGAALEEAREAVHELTYVGEYYAATKPTIIGRDSTDYGFLAIGTGAEAAEAACSYIERIHYAAYRSAEAIAYLRCPTDSPLPSPDVAEQSCQCDIIHDIIGNPFRPISINPIWLTPTAINLAQAAYEERIMPSCELDPARLVVLSDALEEAGCNDVGILEHLRSPGPHTRGCWALDLILDKE